jgi:hypothetical protein
MAEGGGVVVGVNGDFDVDFGVGFRAYIELKLDSGLRANPISESFIIG